MSTTAVLELSDKVSSSLNVSDEKKDEELSFVKSGMIHCHDKDSDDFFRHFQLLEFIGCGSDSLVKKCVEKKSGKVFAVKMIDFTRFENRTDADGMTSSQQIQNEFEILRELKGSDFIAQIHSVFKDASHIFIVLEWYQRGDLFEIVNNSSYMSESKSLRYFKQILTAVNDCHSRGIIHRDVKLENILIDDEDNIRLADFGLARWIKPKEELFELCGTDIYFSPEAIYAKLISSTKSKGYDQKADAWSCGVLLFSMMFGRPPFDHPERVVMFRSIVRGQYTFMDKRSSTLVSPLVKNLIQRLLTVEPHLRISVEDALYHPVFIFNAKKRFRIAVWSIIFLKSMQRRHS